MDKKYIISAIAVAIIAYLIPEIGRFLVSSISLPIWLFSTLLLLSLISIIIVILKFKKPKHIKYTEDIFDGIKWRWGYDLFGNITNPSPYCLIHDMLMVHSNWNNKTYFKCELCKNGPNFPGDIIYNKNKIKRMIDRNIRINFT